MVLNIEAAKPGMMLEEDVLLPSGVVLVNASQVLSDSLIRTMITRGIQKIQVVREETTLQSASDGAEAQEQTPQADELKQQPAEEKPPETPQGPRIKALVSKDGMSAKLCVEPSGAENEPLTPEAIKTAIAEAGIIYGIDDKGISGLVENWTKLKRYYEVDNIAKGTPPQPAKEGIFDFSVRYISSAEQLTEVRKLHYSWELKAAGIEADRVDHDTIIARKQKDQPSVAGKTVKGDEIPTSEIIKTTLNLDSSVRYSSDYTKLIPAVTGIAYVINAAVGVCSIDFNASVNCTVSPDKMSAQLSLHPPGTGGNHPSLGQVQSLLKDNKITHGVLEDAIQQVLSRCALGRYPENAVVIAQGTTPLHGENGSVEFLFNLETSLKPKVNPNGSVDFRNVELVVTVSKDQELARLIAPTKGTPGLDIFGQKVPATDGTPAKLPLGANTAQSPTNPSVMVAATDGNVKYNGAVVEISEGFFVKGNVDFSTGNIRYAKSVIVGGDIGSGFRVECGGDLQASGTIEDAELIVGGNVLCKLGFVGTGKGVIDAKGDVNLAFMKNQIVKCRQNVVIAKEALNCTVYARKTISVHGNPLSIAGGKMMARDSITAYTIGNAGGMKSIIEIGTDFALIDELQKTEGQLAELLENKRKLSLSCKKYERLLEIKQKLAEREEGLYAKLKATLAKFDLQLKALEERKKIITLNMYEFKNAHIKIEHAAMPGTVFKIGSRMLQLKEEVIGPKTVRLVDEEIKIF